MNKRSVQRQQPFTKLKATLWEDEKFLRLSTEGRLLFVWAISPPRGGVLGVFPASVSDLADAIGAPACGVPAERSERIAEALNELWVAQMLIYDEGWCWVVNRLRHALQDAGAKTADVKGKAIDHLMLVPDSNVKQWVKERYGL